MLPYEHMLIFEMALILYNRSASGYTKPWDFKISTLNEKSVIVNFTMRDMGSGSLPVNSALRRNGLAKDHVYSDGYEYYKDCFQPPPYEDYNFPMKDEREDGVREIFIPEHLWGLPPRVLVLLDMYQYFKASTLQSGANYTTPIVNKDGELKNLQNCRAITFYNVPKHKCVAPYNMQIPLEGILNGFLEEWDGTKRGLITPNWGLHEKEVRKKINEI